MFVCDVDVNVNELHSLSCSPAVPAQHWMFYELQFWSLPESIFVPPFLSIGWGGAETASPKSCYVRTVVRGYCRFAEVSASRLVCRCTSRWRGMGTALCVERSYLGFVFVDCPSG